MKKESEKKNHSATAEDGCTMQATKLKALAQWESISSLEFHHIMEMYDVTTILYLLFQHYSSCFLLPIILPQPAPMRAPLDLHVPHDHSQLPCVHHSTCPPRPQPAPMRAPLYMSPTTTASSHACTTLYVSPTTTASSHACTTLRVPHDHSQLPCVHHSTCPPRPQPAPMRAPLYLRTCPHCMGVSRASRSLVPRPPLREPGDEASMYM